jgi:hypothetical protein
VPTTTAITGTGSMPIPAGQTETFTLNGDHIAVICDTGGSATLWATPGEGA